MADQGTPLADVAVSCLEAHDPQRRGSRSRSWDPTEMGMPSSLGRCARTSVCPASPPILDGQIFRRHIATHVDTDTLRTWVPRRCRGNPERLHGSNEDSAFPNADERSSVAVAVLPCESGEKRTTALGPPEHLSFATRGSQARPTGRLRCNRTRTPGQG